MEGVFPPSPPKASLPTSWGKMTSHTLAKVILGGRGWMRPAMTQSRGEGTYPRSRDERPQQN